MKMIVKKFLALAFAAVLVLTVASCNGKAELESGLDLNSLSNELLNGLTWQDQDLAPLPDQLWDRYIDQVDQADLTNHLVIAGGGSTAEEIALFEAKDAASAEKVEDSINERFEYFRTSFGNYTPEQLVNLEDPVLIREGQYVFSVISSENTKAKEIVENWIEKQK